MTKNYRCNVTNQALSEKYAKRHCASRRICGKDPKQGRCSVIAAARVDRSCSQQTPSKLSIFQVLTQARFSPQIQTLYGQILAETQ